MLLLGPCCAHGMLSDDTGSKSVYLYMPSPLNVTYMRETLSWGDTFIIHQCKGVGVGNSRHDNISILRGAGINDRDKTISIEKLKFKI